MDVPPLPPPGGSGGPTGPAGRTPADGGGSSFTTGQRLLAQVIQTLSAGQAVLEVGGQRFLASTPLALAAGQVLEVSVKTLAPTLELVLAGPPVAFSPEAYALAALLTARAESAGRAAPSPDEVRTFLRLVGTALERASSPDAAAIREQLAKLLLPVDVARHGGTLPESLRERLLQSGLMLESRVAGLVGRGAALDAAAMRMVQEDLRALLGQIASESSQTTEIAELRQRVADAAAARQVETAFHRVKDGEWRFDIPVMLGHVETEAHLRVRKDPERDAVERDRPGHRIDLTIDHPELGPVHASARWTPPDLQIRFAVSAASIEPLEHDAAGLVSSLRARGFRDVSVTVDLAPPPAPPAVPDDPSQTLPGGSILRARA